MARRHPTGWEILGFAEDPTPGEPEGIRNLSANYNELSAQANEALQLFGDGSKIKAGKGDAMKGLQARIQEVPQMLDKTAVSFSNAAKAYTRYADLLTDAQSRLDQAIDQGLEAQAEGAGKDKADTPAGATPDQAATDQAANNAIDAANEKLSAAKSLAESARQLREDGSNEAGRMLREAASQAIPARNVFEVASDWLTDNPVFEIVLGVLVAIVAVFFPIFGLIAGLLLLGVQLFKMGMNGKFNVGDILVGVLSIIPGAAALGLLGKLAATVGKIAIVAKVAGAVGKLTGPIKAGIAAMSTAIRAFLNTVGKGIIGTSTHVLLSLGGAVLKDVALNFGLGALGAVVTNAINGTEVNWKDVLIGTAISAALTLPLAAFGASKFGANLKTGITNLGSNSAKANEGFKKAFSKEALGITNGKYSFSSAFVANKGGGMKVDTHGIKTTQSPSTEGKPSTTIETPDGVSTNTGLGPDLDLAPGLSSTTSETTTPDGFTASTKSTPNNQTTTTTIESPQGDTIVNTNTPTGQSTEVSTPVSEGAVKDTAKAVGDTVLPSSVSDKVMSPSPSPLTSTAGPDATTTNLPNDGGSLTHNLPDGNPATVDINPPAGATQADGTTPANPVTVSAHDVSTGNITVTDQGTNGIAVGGDGINVSQNNNVNTVNSGGNPVIAHDFTPGNPSVSHDIGNNQSIDFNPTNPGAGADLPGGGHVKVDNAGHVQVDVPANGGGSHTTTLDGGNTTTFQSQDGTNTTLNNNGGAAITHGDGTKVTIPQNGDGFSVTDGTGTKTTFNNGGNNAVTVNPDGANPVSVGPNGGVTSGPVTTDGQGGGTVVPGGAGTVTFNNNGTTFNGPNGTVNVGHDGSFDVNGINKAPDGTLTTTHFDPGGNPTFQSNTINPDGSGTIRGGGSDYTIDPDGTLNYAPGTDIPQTPVQGPQPQGQTGPLTIDTPIQQPAVGAPVTHGDTTVIKNPDGTTTFTVNGSNGTTATFSPGAHTTTLNHNDVTVTTAPNKTTVTGNDAANPVTVTTNSATDTTTHTTTTSSTIHTGPNNAPVTVNHNNGATSVGPKGTTPKVDVAPTDNGADVTSGATTTHINDNGAAADVNGTNVATTTDTGGQQPQPTTTAPTGNNTSVTADNNGSAISDQGNTFSVGNDGTVTKGPAEITHNRPPAAGPGAEITNSDGGAPFNATVTKDKVDITGSGVHTESQDGGAVKFTDSNAPNTGITANPDGSMNVTHPSGDKATLNPDGSFDVSTPGGPTTHSTSHPNGANGPTTTTTVDHGQGFKTTVTGDNNGLSNTTTHNSGTGHTTNADGSVDVVNPPSKADISVSKDSATVHTPDKHVFGDKGPDVHGGGHDIAFNGDAGNGPVGTTIETPGTHPVQEPGSTTFQHADGTGNVDVTYGPVKGSYGPEGVHSVGPEPGGNTQGTNGKPVDITTVNGDGKGGITVQAPGNGPTIHHEGGDRNLGTGGGGGKTTVDTGSTTITKTEEPPNPKDLSANDRNGIGPETFKVKHNNANEPSVEVPVGGQGSKVTSAGDNYTVTTKNDGTFEVTATNDPNDKVTVGNKGALFDANGNPLPPSHPGAPPIQTHALNDGTVITSVYGGDVIVKSPTTGAPETVITNGTATTSSGNTTITQPSDGGKPTYTTADGNTSLTIGPKGVDGTHSVPNLDGTHTVYKIDAGNTGAASVTNTTSKKTTSVDANGSYSEQHNPLHDYTAHIDPSGAKDWAWDIATGQITGLANTAAQAAYKIGQGGDPDAVWQDAWAGHARGITNTLANSKPATAHVFNGNSVETVLVDLPKKIFGYGDGAVDTGALDADDPTRISTKEIKNGGPGIHAPTDPRQPTA
ncbi:beta strand repeat-containing protein [Streptomyces sp. NPDC053427]|uniref:beta strand repeat-containing protein n=1 Tax=Streptomyces sp. NPDC053427 TaxID=3365701 RepID=UPI0037CE8A82